MRIRPCFDRVIRSARKGPSAVILVQTVMVLVLCSCAAVNFRAETPTAATDDETAKQTLIRFFRDLHDGDYPSAADRYAGSYETMVEHNPGIEPEDHPALLEAACTINGAQCLPVRDAQLVGAESSDGEIVFLVRFEEDDGSVFELGPCCGGDGDGAAPQTEFKFHVLRGSDGRFRVTTQPMYTP